MAWDIDRWAKFFQIVAVVVGGLWVWVNSIRGRVFAPRLQLEFSGKLVSVGGTPHLRVTIQYKNAGSSIVRLQERGNAVVIYPLLKGPLGEETIEETPDIMAVRVLQTYIPVYNESTRQMTARSRPMELIEPGTAINQEYLIPVPAEYNAFKLELKVALYKAVSFWQWPVWIWQWLVWILKRLPTLLLKGEKPTKPNKPGTTLSTTTVAACDDALLRADKSITL